MAGSSVAERLNKINLEIAASCTRAGRARGSVHLLAVSKLQPAAAVSAAVAAGQIDFAENYVPEALDKLNKFNEIRWHFIGRIQSNKVKNLVGRFAIIHSVDRVSIVEELARRSREASRRQDIFLQFNAAGEVSKGGAGEAELGELFEAARAQSSLRILGLMVMPPLQEDAEKSRPYFRRAREILSELRDDQHPLNELSMGTSADFSVAIEEGATWVRVGSDIFGPRPAKENS